MTNKQNIGGKPIGLIGTKVGIQF